MARVYATLADLTSYAPAGVTVPADPEGTRLLTSASQLVERATMTSVYDTDSTTGYPTNADVIEAFQRATCAQAVWWLETGDELGIAGQYDTVSIGSVSLSRGTRTPPPGQRLAPQAETELRNGLLLVGSVVGIYTWEGSWL